MSESNDRGAAKSILILGGTGEARALAGALFARGLDVTTALAGRTQSPRLPEGRVRIGGFGGAEGLAAFLAAEKFEWLVDATHPFAAQISANAVAAAEIAGIPLLRLTRPGWTQPPGAAWLPVADMAAAATALPHGARVLLTIGRQEVSAFFSRSDCTFIARVIDAPDTVPEGWKIITARGPFTRDEELALLRDEGITHLVSKNAGGDQTRAKIDAAHALGLPVVMVERPALPEAETVATIEAALAWLERH